MVSENSKNLQIGHKTADWQFIEEELIFSHQSDFVPYHGLELCSKRAWSVLPMANVYSTSSNQITCKLQCRNGQMWDVQPPATLLVSLSKVYTSPVLTEK